MIILETTSMGCTYIDDDGNYLATLPGNYPGDPHIPYPVALGPWEFSEDDIPF